MPVAYIGLGTNLGNRYRQLQAAVEALRALPQTQVQGVSRIYETPPWGITAQPNFLNAVVCLHTTLEPVKLLSHLKAIERQLGRPEHYARWTARPIDLDILLYDDVVMESPLLTIPHPELCCRKFVLVPLLDLANPLHPVAKKTIAELLSEIGDCSEIVPTDYVL